MRHVTTRFAGLVILIAGIWGGLIPFVGPYFHFVLGPDQHWKWTTGRLWLNVLPGAVAALGGLILMGGGPRVSGRFGALLALAAGIWFAVGPDVSMLWNHGVAQSGVPHGRHTFKRMLELLTFHSGLGVLITAFAAYALPGAPTYPAGRRRGRAGRDTAIAGTGAAAGAAEAHHRDRVAEREGAGGAGAGTAAGAGTGTAAREPIADREATAGEPATEPVNREPVAEREGAGGSGAGAGNRGAGGAGPAAGAGGPQRRGGLLSRLFGRT